MGRFLGGGNRKVLTRLSGQEETLSKKAKDWACNLQTVHRKLDRQQNVIRKEQSQTQGGSVVSLGHNDVVPTSTQRSQAGLSHGGTQLRSAGEGWGVEEPRAPSFLGEVHSHNTSS